MEFNSSLRLSLLSTMFISFSKVENLSISVSVSKLLAILSGYKDVLDISSPQFSQMLFSDIFLCS